jgi:basic membrane protein A
MRRNKLFWILALFVVGSLVLSACGPEATPTPTTEPTEVVEETEEPTEEVAEEPTEEATEEATEEPTEEATEEAMEEEPTEEATEEVAEEPTEEATEEMAEEPTEEATEEEAAVAEAGESIKIGLVTDVGEVDDRSFNQSAWEGVQAAAEAAGGEASYIETQDSTDYATNIAEFAENDYDVIVTVGFALSEATLQAAADYPDIYFIGVDQFQGEVMDNVVGLVFHEDQAGYLAGVLAARLTESGTIAGVYGTDLVPAVVAFARGYEAGAAATNPDINVITTFHPGGLDVAFTDPEWGGGTAAQAIDQGADVVFSAGGKTGNGGLTETANRTSEDEMIYCIGVDTDQWETLPEAHDCLVSSAMKVIPTGVQEIMDQYLAGEPASGNFFGPVGLAPFHDFADSVPQDVQDELATLAEQLAAGELETGVDMSAPADEEPAEEEAAEEPTEEAAEEEMAEEPTEEAAAEEMAEEPTEEPAEEKVMGDNIVTVAPGDPIVLGFAAALSGEGVEPLGVDEQRGAELALADMAPLTVGDVEFEVELDSQDALCSGEGGQSVANRFASDENIVGVIGHMCSSSCTAALSVYEGAGMTMISPSCTAPNLTEAGSLAFDRVVITDAFQGPTAAEFIYNDLGITTIATIHDGSTYGEGLVNATSDAFVELGGEVVATQAINVGETDFRGVLEGIAAEEPGLVYFAGFVAEGARLAEQRADVGLEEVPFMGADGIYTPEFIELAGSDAEGVYASSAVPPSGDAYDNFLAAYDEAYGEAPIGPYHATTYDAVGVMLNAIQEVGVIDADGNLVIDRDALAEAIRGTSDFEGLTGVLTCDENGECGNAVVDVFVVEDEAWVSTSAE